MKDQLGTRFSALKCSYHLKIRIINNKNTATNTIHAKFKECWGRKKNTSGVDILFVMQY